MLLVLRQSFLLVLPAGAKLPIAYVVSVAMLAELSRHSMQVDSAVAPVADEKVPAGQSMQVAAAVEPEYLPAGQVRQLAIAVAPVEAEYLLATQSSHGKLVVPKVVRYLPATQSTQTLAAATVHFPAPH